MTRLFHLVVFLRKLCLIKFYIPNPIKVKNNNVVKIERKISSSATPPPSYLNVVDVRHNSTNTSWGGPTRIWKSCGTVKIVDSLIDSNIVIGKGSFQIF